MLRNLSLLLHERCGKFQDMPKQHQQGSDTDVRAKVERNLSLSISEPLVGLVLHVRVCPFD